MARDYLTFQVLIIWATVSLLFGALNVLFFLVIFLDGFALPVTISVPVSVTLMALTIFASTIYFRRSLDLRKRKQYRSIPQIFFLVALTVYVLISYWDYLSPRSPGDVLRQSITTLSYPVFGLAIGIMGHYLVVPRGHSRLAK